MDIRQMLVMGLAATAAGGLTYAFVLPYFDGGIQGEKRQEKVTTVRTDKPEGSSKLSRSKQVAESLKEIERKKADQDKVTLQDKIIQAGLDWDRKKFFTISIVLGVVGFLVGLMASGNIFFGVAGAVVGGLGLPNWMLVFLRKRRVKKFIKEFPDAVDVIVRGIKSGLPLGDCIRIIASEAQEPVKTEFRQIVEAQTLGLSLPEAVSGLFQRVPTAEANFFGIVIEIQSKAGGNLSEVLANLSKVLRERRKMRDKVAAMSMEAKASAGIIGSLPPIVILLVYLTTPAYIMILFQTDAGKFALCIGGFLMFCGVFSMKKMIAFDI
ncbi:MAG: type II secretion system F family protein [Proteobacteria bacterium]|nr:type II secretion system F family protein [Pseudomonadota bacterium]